MDGITKILYVYTIKYKRLHLGGYPNIGAITTILTSHPTKYIVGDITYSYFSSGDIDSVIGFLQRYKISLWKKIKLELLGKYK